MRQGSGFVDFLAFRKMITPVIIQILFWLGLVFCLIAGVGLIIEGSGSRYGVEQVVAGLLLLVFGPIAWRVYCEVLILFFRMNSTLSDIRRNTLR
ncbi:MAG: DUF4282 domain-containing protein [Planctomycetota bacterium]